MATSLERTVLVCFECISSSKSISAKTVYYSALCVLSSGSKKDWFEICAVEIPHWPSNTVTVTAETDDDPDLTCDDDLGVIGLHVPIIHSCSLSLSLLLGFLGIKRIGVVL